SPGRRVEHVVVDGLPAPRQRLALFAEGHRRALRERAGRRAEEDHRRQRGTVLEPRELTFRWFEFTVLVRDLDPQAHMANHVYVASLSEARSRFMREIDPDARLFRPSVVADVHVKYLSSLQPREIFRV